ncbi:ABC transporter permease [soil metagenome]
MHTFTKYLGLFRSFFKASLMSELEYRFNIGARIVTDVIWYAAQLSVFEVLFRHTSSLNGWSLGETRVFMGILFVTDALYMMLFSENLDRMGDKVRKGDLDLLLVKPVNSQWMLSFQKVSVAYIGNFFLAWCWLIWALSRIPNFEWSSLFWLTLTVPVSITIIYSIRFMTSATALFFTRADAVNYIWYQVYRLGTRPHGFYPVVLRFAVLTILPIAFLASVPAQVILGKMGPLVLIWGFLVGAVLIKLSTAVWRRGLKAYSSASS